MIPEIERIKGRVEYKSITPRAEAYASEYLAPRKDRFPLRKDVDNAWIAVRAGYSQGAADASDDTIRLLDCVSVLWAALEKAGYTESGDKIVGTSNRMARINFERVCNVARTALSDARKILGSEQEGEQK